MTFLIKKHIYIFQLIQPYFCEFQHEFQSWIGIFACRKIKSNTHTHLQNYTDHRHQWKWCDSKNCFKNTRHFWVKSQDKKILEEKETYMQTHTNTRDLKYHTYWLVSQEKKSLERFWGGLYKLISIQSHCASVLDLAWVKWLNMHDKWQKETENIFLFFSYC